jgi:glycerophosphoryl diester phosphodiesterase
VDWRARGIGLRVGGHRGDPENAPENTLSAFEAAVAAGVDYVETDARLSSDGVIVLLHDDDLDRTTDGSGPVAASSAEEILALDAGAWFGPEFAGERVPTADEFLAWVSAHDSLGAEIDVKAHGVGARLAEAITRSPSQPQLSVCSEYADELREVKRISPEIPCFLILDKSLQQDPIELVRACAADGADLPWEWLDERLVARMREAEIAIMGATANDELVLEELLRRGADFVDSDLPRLAVAVRAGLTGSP